MTARLLEAAALCGNSAAGTGSHNVAGRHHRQPRAPVAAGPEFPPRPPFGRRL